MTNTTARQILSDTPVPWTDAQVAAGHDSDRTILDYIAQRRGPYEFGAVGDGTTNDRAALSALDGATNHKYASSGTFRVNSNLTLTGTWEFADGAKLKPASGVTITLACIPLARHQIFDLSLGGTIAIDKTGPLSEVYAAWWGCSPQASAATNTAAIHAARTAAGVPWATYGSLGQQPARTIYLPGGRLSVTNVVWDTYTCLNLVGEGREATTLTSGSGGTVFQVSSSAYNRFSNFGIDGRSLAKHGFVISDDMGAVTGVTINNVVDDVLVSNVVDPAGYAFYVGTFGTDAWQVSENLLRTVYVDNVYNAVIVKGQQTIQNHVDHLVCDRMAGGIVVTTVGGQSNTFGKISAVGTIAKLIEVQTTTDTVNGIGVGEAYTEMGSGIPVHVRNLTYKVASFVAATDTITTDLAYSFVTGQAVVYNANGGSITGLVDGTVYYANVITSGTTSTGGTLKLYDTSGHAISGGATGLVDLSGSLTGSPELTLYAIYGANVRLRNVHITWTGTTAADTLVKQEAGTVDYDGLYILGSGSSRQGKIKILHGAAGLGGICVARGRIEAVNFSALTWDRGAGNEYDLYVGGRRHIQGNAARASADSHTINVIRATHLGSFNRASIAFWTGDPLAGGALDGYVESINGSTGSVTMYDASGNPTSPYRSSGSPEGSFAAPGRHDLDAVQCILVRRLHVD
jgi:hypothetical protein